MKKIFFIIIIVLFCLFLYGKYISPSILKVKEYTIASSKIPDGFDGMKIVHFSDLYYGGNDNYEMLKKLVEKINEQEADIIIFTGDLLSKDLNDKQKNKVIKKMQELSSDYKYAISGDNDHELSKEILNSSGFTLLDQNSAYIFNNDNEPILIAGGKDLEEQDLLYDEEIDYNFIITLLHKPDDIDSLDYNSDVVLSGHSLGGQIRVPFVGAIMRTKGAKKYTNDYHQKGNTDLYITYGIGLGNLKMRLFDDPSINLYRLNSKK